MSRLKRYFANLLVGVDQLGNALLGGDPDETISSRIGKVKRKHGGRIPWRYPLLHIIDGILEGFDDNHSMEAIEDDEGGDAVLSREYATFEARFNAAIDAIKAEDTEENWRRLLNCSFDVITKDVVAGYKRRRVRRD